MSSKTLSLRVLASRFVTITFYFTAAQIASAQDNVGEDSTVVYPASYFAEFNPVTAQDMLDRIPGVGSARRGAVEEALEVLVREAVMVAEALAAAAVAVR